VIWQGAEAADSNTEAACGQVREFCGDSLTVNGPPKSGHMDVSFWEKLPFAVIPRNFCFRPNASVSN